MEGITPESEIEQDREQVLAVIEKEVPEYLRQSIQCAIDCFAEPNYTLDITLSWEGACNGNQG
ncbi:MAG TPA: hypothetical protein PKZ25_12795 [Candidatus Hydrogenedentes bacterium]|nr:hypothetical protein [Candidatus Hydrogenedentota bacterium]